MDLLSHLLDDWFRIPGTSIRFGLDGIVGFIPGVGGLLVSWAVRGMTPTPWVRQFGVALGLIVPMH